ncbi:MAG: hypothetical protein NC124_16540 [Clostridium sp.]|nr:hypothetical protein [Clostridium sp.]
MNTAQKSRMIGNKSLNPKIEMFNPFNRPFVDSNTDEQPVVITKFVIVSPKVVEYMIDDNTKIVAKCTPCQCCACR